MRLDRRVPAATWRRLGWWLGRREGALILTYHRIAAPARDAFGLCVEPQRFAEQLEVLSRHVRVLRLRDLAQALMEGRLPRRACVVTFDDGYADNLHAARPLLERYGIPATVFVVSGGLDESCEFWWDELEQIVFDPAAVPAELLRAVDGSSPRPRLARSRPDLYRRLWCRLQPLPENERRGALQALAAAAGVRPRRRESHRRLSAGELGALAADGLVDLGAHTVSHPLLPRLPAAAQRQEILASRRSLEALTGREVASFAYPHGESTPATSHLVRDAGFACACTNLSDVVGPAGELFALPRVHVRDWDGERFARRLATGFLWG